MMDIQGRQVIKIKPTTLGALLISFSAILWGFDGVVLTPRLFNLDVAFVVFMLHLVPFAIMNLFMYREYRYLTKFTREDFLTFFLVALFGGALGTLSIVKALFLVNFHQLSVVVLLQKLQPIFAIALAALILKERLTKRFLSLAGLAIIASYFLVFGFSLPDLSASNTGLAAMYAIIAAFSFGSATVFGKKVLNKYPFHTANFYRFGLTAAMMYVYVFFTGKFTYSEITPMNWMIFLLIAFTTGSGAIFLYYFGLKRVRASVSTICELMFPVSAILFDYLINKSTLSLVQFASAGAITWIVIHLSRMQNKISN